MQIVTSEYNESKKMGMKTARKCTKNPKWMRNIQREWEAEVESWSVPGYDVEYSRARGFLDGILEVAK